MAIQILVPLVPSLEPAPAPPRAPDITPPSDREPTRNDRREAGKDERPLNFRAVLSAETFGNLAEAVGAVRADAERDAQKTPRMTRTTRVPKGEPTILSATESAAPDAAAQASEQDARITSAHRTAATRYTKSFFSVDGPTRVRVALEIKA